MTHIAIYPGSFDPITLGHLDIVQRASQLFDRVVMGVATNLSKQPLFSLDTRLGLIRQCVGHLSNVAVESFDGLTVDFARSHGARVIVRGLRAVSDFEFETMMSQMNKTLAPELETVFMMAGLEYQFLSSSLVKELARLGGSLTGLVPPPVAEAFRQLPPPPDSPHPPSPQG